MPVTQEMQSLGDVLSRRTVEGELYEKLEKNAVRCFSCGHRCFIPEGLKQGLSHGWTALHGRVQKQAAARR